MSEPVVPEYTEEKRRRVTVALWAEVTDYRPDHQVPDRPAAVQEAVAPREAQAAEVRCL